MGELVQEKNKKPKVNKSKKEKFEMDEDKCVDDKEKKQTNNEVKEADSFLSDGVELCQYCQRIFLSSSGLKDHIETEHRANEDADDEHDDLEDEQNDKKRSPKRGSKKRKSKNDSNDVIDTDSDEDDDEILKSPPKQKGKRKEKGSERKPVEIKITKPAENERKQSSVSLADDSGLACYNCGKECKNKTELKNH